MKRLIINGSVYYKGAFVKKDILIIKDKFAEIKDKITEAADEVIDAKGKYIFPGFVDIHCHLRDPGQTYKEDIITGTKAAAKGGFTTICAMPNTDPVIDNIAGVEFVQRRAKDLGFCKVKVIGAITKQIEGKEISEMASMQEGGIVAVSDDGHCVQNGKLMLNCMKYAANFHIPVIIHAEDYNLAGKGQIHSGKIATQLGLSSIPSIAEEVIIARDIMLAESTKCALHVAHVSSAKALELIKAAKAKGLPVTCEVTPHHLTLNETACVNFDTNTKCKPPLRSEKDRLALLEALNSGLIDCIATDHAPHADYEKELEFDKAPFGINGFEAAFASLYTQLVSKGHMTLERLIEAMTSAPAKLLGIKAGVIEKGMPADLTIADLKGKFTLTTENMLSKAKNTPWLNKPLQGKIITTICDGKVTWQAE
jgi:dihydroorotase